MESKAKPAQAGGRVVPSSCGNAPNAAKLQTLAIMLLNFETRAHQAHQALENGTSVSADFLSNKQLEELRQSLRQRLADVLKGVGGVIEIHCQQRSIHERQELLDALQEEIEKDRARYL